MLLAIPFLLSACAYEQYGTNIDTSTVRDFDLRNFMGRWYEIARFDHRFERGMSDVVADYTLLPNGRIEVVNSGMKDGQLSIAKGKAKISKIPGKLRVSFFWFFYADYNVLAMGQDGEWALIGSKSPKYLWILSRTPTLPEPTLQHIIDIARARGYNTEKLIIDND